MLLSYTFLNETVAEITFFFLSDLIVSYRETSKLVHGFSSENNISVILKGWLITYLYDLLFLKQFVLGVQKTVAWLFLWQSTIPRPEGPGKRGGLDLQGHLPSCEAAASAFLCCLLRLGVKLKVQNCSVHFITIEVRPHKNYVWALFSCIFILIL